jgi:hypothetical protein
VTSTIVVFLVLTLLLGTPWPVAFMLAVLWYCLMEPGRDEDDRP